MIKITNLSKTYFTDNDKVEVLKDVSISLPEMGFISLLGKSGSGKSTFLNILGGIDSYDKGSIIFDDIEYNQINSTDYDKLRAEMISFVFQEENLIQDFTILENLLFVQQDKSVEVIKKKLKEFDLVDKIDKFPYELSGGEKQRIAIIRSLLKKSRILLVDEPTGNLDEESSSMVLKTLHEVSKQKLVVMITHDKEYAEKYSDKIYEIVNKQIISSTEDMVIHKEVNTGLNDIKSPKISIMNLIRICMKSLSNKKLRLVQYVFLLSITLFLLGLSYSTLFVNEYSIASNTFIDEGIEFIYLRTESDNYFSMEDYNQCNVDVNCEILFNDFSFYYKSSSGEPLFGANYSPFYSAVSYEHNTKNILHGDYPDDLSNVIISDYLAISFIESDILSGSDISDIVGQKLPDTSIEIVGVYRTDYTDYLDILSSETYYQYSDNINEAVKSEISYKINNFYSILYVSDDFDYSLLGVQMKGKIENANISSQVNINPINSQDITDYSLSVENENDIYISKFLLFEMLSESDSNITNYQQFLSAWNDDEENITNNVIGTTYAISFISSSQKYLDNSYSFPLHEEIYTIKGIIDYDDGNNSVYISSKDYNEGFSNIFSLIVPIESSSLANEVNLKYIRENEIYYDSLSSDSIIKYVESDGEILSIVAFIISFVFIIFSVVLYNSLISRDVLHKRKLIGLLRSMGFRTSNIFGIFVFEVIAITFLSLLISLALQPMGINFLNTLVSTGSSKLNVIAFDFRMVGLLLVSSILFSILSLILPYRKITSISIRECIKVEV